METFAAAQQRSQMLLRTVVSDPNKYKVLTGERPTGALHLGHYFGSIVERLRLQRAGVESFVILADYQVITDRDSMANVRASVLVLFWTTWPPGWILMRAPSLLIRPCQPSIN